ncbi:MAG: hypothetical protein GC158_05575 [Cyanobacteria bacterium RI_101]|nr:hypothetical protein [Cyanobacteria bacterium RI_101]
MTITLTNRLSAITTDSFGETHLVWADSGNLWRAVYDNNSGTWRDAQIIAAGLSENITSLNLVASETLIQDSSNINSPGLVVVYQQGSENDSDIFYTAAQYTAQGQLRWLASPQALTSDQVGDLEPRAIANDGAVFVVGQKVNADNVQNFSVREDADLYYQSFTVNSSQFPTPALDLTFNTNSTNTPYTLETLASSFTTAQKKKAKVFQGSGFNWNASQYFDTNLLEFNLLNQSPDQPNGYLGNLFKRINIAGSLQAASGGKNPELTLINGVQGPLLNVAASISYQTAKQGKNGKPNKDFQGGIGSGNYFSASLGFSTLYNYSNTPNSEGYFPFANEKGSLGLSFGLKLPLYTEPPFFVDFLGSAGVAFQWQLSPNPNKSYVPPLSPYLAPNSSGSDAILAASIAIPPVGAVEAIALALLSDITEIIGRADDNLVLDGLDVSIPIRAGLAGGISIPYLFQAILSAQVYLNGKFTFAEQTPATGAFTLGVPIRLTVKTLGFLGGTLEYFPEWKWSWDLSTAGEISGALLNDGFSAASDASVQGSLITLNLEEPLIAPFNLDPNDFEVTVANADGSTVTIPVFGVVAPAGSEVVSFRLEQTIPYQSSVGFEQSPTIELIYNGSEPLSWFDGDSVPVSNASSPNFVYTYNPTGGTDDDYSGTSNQLVINFNTQLNPQIIPDVSQFTLENSDVTVTSVLGVTNQTVALELSAPLAGAFTVSYQPNDQGLQLQDSNNNPLPSFTFESGAVSNTGLVNSLFSNSIATTSVIAEIANDFAQDQTPALALTASNNILMAWSSDAPPLAPISAVVNPDNSSQIYINFLVSNLDEALGGAPQPQQFQVFVNGNPNPVTSVAAPDLGVVALNLASPINSGETVTVSYRLNSDPNESADNLFLTDVTGTTLWIPAFENVAVANNNDGAGQPLAAVATLTTYQGNIATALTLTFAQNIDSSSLDLSQFSVYANNQSLTVEPNYASSQNALSLILGEPVRQGDLISVYYSPNENNEGALKDSNGLPLNSFEVQQVVTAPAVASAVIKTTTNASNAKLESIPGTGNSLDFDPAAIAYNGQNIVAWARVDSGNLNNQAIPGQIYSEEDAAQINQALSASDIYYSLYNPTLGLWSVAAPIALDQAGQDQKVTLGLGPDNEVIAAWLNTTNDNNETTTSIYWSTFDGAGWTTPTPVLAEITPDAFTELSIEMLGGEPAVFWTESQPSAYSSLVLADNPLIYLRLEELTGTVANNLGTLGSAANGAYTGTVTLKQMGALENPETSTGDPNPAAQFDGGGSLTLDTALPLTSQGWAVEFWFKVADLPAAALNLLSLELNFLSLEPPNSGSNPVFELSLNGSTLSLNFEGGSLQAPNVTANTWYYVVGSYDGADNTLSLYLNGSLVETSILTLTEPLPNTAQLTLAGGDSALFLDEVAFYGSPLANATTPFQSLTADNFTTIPGDQILNQSFGVNPIGSRYTAQYNDPVPAGPEVYYSVLSGSTWQAPEQINPIAAIVPTILSDANPALWDIVSNAAVVNGSRISPNGIADTLFQSTLVSQVGQTLIGISLVVDSQTYSLGTQFNNGSQTLLAGNQLGVIIGDALINSLNPTEAATDLSYPIRSESLDLVLAIDTGTAPNLGNLPTVDSYALYFADGNSVVYSSTQNPSDLPVFIPPNSEPATADNTQVLGVATVTEANDSSLGQIDSGFIINTDNSAIATVLAKGLNNGQLAYIAVGNRGYTNTSGMVVTPPGGGTVQILLAGEDALNNKTTIPLSTTNLLGNPNGILITGLTDNGSANNHVAMSLATGDVDGDGVDDLVIGDANANNGAGAIYAIYGSYLTDPLNAGKTLNVITELETTPSSVGFLVNGADPNGGAGFAVAVGNFFNSDGTLAQIAFGAPFAQSEGVSAGKVYLVSVSAATATPTTSLLYTGQTFNITNSNGQAETAGEAAGYSLGVSALKTGAPTPFSGSILGDDLLIGAPGYRQNVTNQWTNLNQLPSGNQGDYPAQSWVATGAVRVFSAQANNGLIRSTQLATYTGANVLDVNGVAANYFAGAAIAAEDFNGDGRQDLAISAEGVNGNAGAVYVINGQDAPVASSSSPLIIPLIPLNTASNLTLNGGIPTARVGTVITAAGDINDDKHQDFLITAPQALNGAGQSYLLFGPLNLDQVGASLDLDIVSGDSGQVFLLNGDFPYQLAGTGAIGAGDINGDGADDLLLSAPNAQQLYAVYGHPWLADDGSIKLADLSADNGFVIDGDLVSSPLVTLFSDSLNNSPSKASPALIANNGALYLAYTDSNGQIHFTTSANNGQTWSQAVPLPSDAQTVFAPSLAFYNDVLYLAYVDAANGLYVAYSADNGQTWNSPYQLGGLSSTAPTLIVYQNTLFFFFTADNPTSSILYYYADNPNANAQNPLTSADWIYSDQIVGGDYSASSDMSAAVVDNTLYLALNGGTVNNSSGDIYLVAGSGDDPANLTWSDYAVPNLGATRVAPGLTTDGETLYLTYTDESAGNVNLTLSADGTNPNNWTSSQTLDGLPGQILPVLAATDNQLYLAYAGASQGLYVAESPLPFVDSIVGNGGIVELLGDVNGDGFGDIFSGGANAGVVVFGKSTDALLDAALLSDDLIITLANANLQDVISLGDFNGDGFKDFGVLDSNGNFYVVLGNTNLGDLRQLSVSASSTPVVIAEVGGVSQSMAIGDYNGDGYDDVLLRGDNVNQVGWGNSDGALNSFTNIDYPETQTSTTGVDLNGDGITEIAIGSDTSPIAGAISTTGSFSLLSTPTASSVINTLAAANQLQTIGDFNGDGIEDLAVLASNYYAATLGSPLNVNQAGNQGGVFIYYGSVQGLSDNAQPNVILAAPFTTVSGQQSPFYLSEIAQAGDVNGDGFDDVLISSPFTVTTNVTANDQGSVFVVFGGNSWSAQPFDLGQLSANQQNNGSTTYGFLVNGLPNAQAGIAISGGSDVNGDGFDDLAIGAPGNYESQLSQNTVIGDDKGRIWYNGQQINFGVSDPAVISMAAQENASGGVSQVVVGLVNGEVWWYNGSIWSQLNSSDVVNSWASSINALSVQWNQEEGQPPQVIVGLGGDGGVFLFNGDVNNWSTLIDSAEGSPVTQMAVNWQENPPQVVVGYQDGTVAYSVDYSPNTNTFPQPSSSNSSIPITQMAVNWQENGAPQIVIGLGDKGGAEYYDGSNWTILENLNPAWSSSVKQMSAQWNTQGQPQIVVGLNDGAILYYNGSGGFGGLPGGGVAPYPVTQMAAQWNADGAPQIVAALGDKGGVEYYNGSQWVTVADANPGWSSPVTQMSAQWGRDGEPDIVVGLQNGAAIALSYNGSGWDQNGVANVGTAINQLTSLWSESLVNSGNGDNLSYVLFGDDFTHTVTQTGTIGADVMLGTATGESFVSGQGDDQVYGQGGVDVVYAGPGDDLVTVTDTYFRRLDGGTGLDTLQFTGYNGQAWDLTTLSPGLRLRNFEILDTRNYGANTLTLNAVTVSQLSSNNTLTLFMDAADSLALSADFSQEGTVYQDGQNFLQFTSSSSAATVLLNIPVANVTFTAPSANTPASIPPNESPAAPATLAQGAPLQSGDGSTYLYVDNPIVSEATGEATFTIQRTGDLSQYLSVAYQTQDGDGKAGNRYLPVAGQLTFNPGESAKTVSVPIPNDGIYTGDRQFGLLVTRLETGAEAEARRLVVDPQGAQIRNWRASPENGAVRFAATASAGTPVNLEFTLTGTEPRALPQFWNTESQSFTALPWSGDNTLSLTYDPAQSRQTYRLQLEEGGAFDADGATNGLLNLSVQMPALNSAPLPISRERTEGTQDADFLSAAGLTGDFHPWGSDFRLWGLRGNDLLLGSEQRDLLQGNFADDQLFGQGGVDRLYGGLGNDYLDGGPERDFLRGGKGADLFVLRLGEGTDQLLDFNPLEGDRIALAGLGFNDLTFSVNQILVGSTALALVFDQQGQPLTDWSAGSAWFVSL